LGQFAPFRIGFPALRCPVERVNGHVVRRHCLSVVPVGSALSATIAGMITAASYAISRLTWPSNFCAYFAGIMKLGENR
jgi:hypothetical protein